MLEPMTLPRLRPLLPVRPAVMDTEASGRLVPMATTVRPMTTPGTRSRRATPEEPSTKKSAPLTSSTKPTTSTRQLISIAIVY